MTLNLHELVRDIVRSSDLPNPADLVPLVLAALDTPARRDEALRQSLHGVVRETVRSERAVTPFRPEPQPTTAPARTCVSRKFTTYAAVHERMLRERLSVAGGRWLFLGDCTAGDLSYVVEQRRDLAARNAARGDAYERLAKALAEHGVEHVRDLPADVLAEHAGVA